jgi:hypothetical protein
MATSTYDEKTELGTEVVAIVSSLDSSLLTGQCTSTSITAWAKACGASWGRLCPDTTTGQAVFIICLTLNSAAEWAGSMFQTLEAVVAAVGVAVDVVRVILANLLYNCWIGLRTDISRLAQ